MISRNAFTFNVGDTVYYPGHGTCTVKTVYEHKHDSETEPTFVLKPKNALSSLQRLVLPLGKAFELGVHKLNPQANSLRVWKILNSPPGDLSKDKNFGYRETREKLCSGDLTKIAEAARDLNATRDFMFFSGRKHLLRLAKRMLVDELAYIEGKAEKQIGREVEERLTLTKKGGNHEKNV